MSNSQLFFDKIVHEKLMSTFTKEQIAIIATASLGFLLSENLEETTRFLDEKKKSFDESDIFH